MNQLPLWAAIPVVLLLCAGGILTLIGAIGLLRLPHFYARMHGPALGNTLGAACVLLASILAFSVLGQRMVVQEVLISVFLLMTSPVTAMLLMRAALFEDGRDKTD